jgi:hypothetical protein
MRLPVPQTEKQVRNVLSIDGGGYRGLGCLIFLETIMSSLALDKGKFESDAPRPCEIFDLICGTSTGGIIAILLGRLGLTCEEAIREYKALGRAAFEEETMDEDETTNGEVNATQMNERIWREILRGKKFSKDKFEKKLEEVVERYTRDPRAAMFPGKEKLELEKHESTKTFVPVASISVGAPSVEPHRIRSYRTPPFAVASIPSGYKWSIKEAARGTSATLMYFDPLILAPKSALVQYFFQDAGQLKYTNPSDLALSEAKLLFNDDEIVLISLGTGLKDLRVVDEENKEAGPEAKEAAVERLRGLLGMTPTEANDEQRIRKFVRELMDVASDSEVSHDATSRKLDHQENNYFRFNPKQGLAEISFWDYKQESAIRELTKTEIDKEKHFISDVIARLQPRYDQLLQKQAEGGN